MESPSLYASANANNRRDVEETLRAYVHRMKWNDNEIVLDVGCGPGDATRDILLPQLPSRGCHLVGVDVSQNMVDYASKNFSHNSIEYRVLDIASKDNPRLIFPDGFSKIFSSFCLMYVQDQSAGMKNLFSLLRPSGEALLVLAGDLITYKSYGPMSQLPKWAPFMKDVSDHTSVYFHENKRAELLARTAKEAGFEVLSSIELEKTYDYESMEYFKRKITSVNPFIVRMPEQTKEEYIDATMKWIGEDNKKITGSETTFRYTLLVAHLQKPM